MRTLQCGVRRSRSGDRSRSSWFESSTLPRGRARRETTMATSVAARVRAGVPHGSGADALRLRAVLAFATLSFDRALVDAVAGGTLVVLAAIDLERRIIPNRIVAPAATVVLLLNVALFPGRSGEWLLAAILGAVVFAVPALLGRN